MAPDHILALDNGTQSVRALLFDLQGNLLAKERVLSIHIIHPSLDGQSRTRNFFGRHSARLVRGFGSSLAWINKQSRQLRLQPSVRP